MCRIMCCGSGFAVIRNILRILIHISDGLTVWIQICKNVTRDPAFKIKIAEQNLLVFN